MSGKHVGRPRDPRHISFVGLDLYKKCIECAVMNIAGNVLRQGRVENTLNKMGEFSESVPRKSSMVIESS